jgi:GTP cyclohydrolase III
VETAPLSEFYAYFDGDDVGAHIELRLLENDASGAALVSLRVSEAISWLKAHLEEHFEAVVLFAAGDEVFAQLGSSPTSEQLDRVRDDFRARCSLSISCGIGDSPRRASQQLRLAKLRGKNQSQGWING